MKLYTTVIQKIESVARIGVAFVACVFDMLRQWRCDSINSGMSKDGYGMLHELVQLPVKPRLLRCRAIHDGGSHASSISVIVTASSLGFWKIGHQSLA